MKAVNPSDTESEKIITSRKSNFLALRLQAEATNNFPKKISLLSEARSLLIHAESHPSIKIVNEISDFQAHNKLTKEINSIMCDFPWSGTSS